MKNSETIGVLHVILIAVTVIGLKNHVTILPPLLEKVGRDGWISVLVAAFGSLLWLPLFVYLIRSMQGQSMRDWLDEKLGKGGPFLRYLIAIFLLSISAFTMIETLQWVTATFLPVTPPIILLLFYVVLCVYLATTSIQTIAMTNVVVLFFVVIFGFFVAFTNLQVKDYNLLKPFLEHGFEPVARGIVFPLSGFSEIFLLLFIHQKVNKQLKYRHFVWIVAILTMLTLGPLTGAITEFGPTEASEQRYPAYEEWGLVRIGRFIEHVDFLSVYQWLTGTFIRLSFILYIVIDLVRWENKKIQIWRVIAPLFFFLSIPLFTLDDHHFLMVKGKYVLTNTFFFFLVCSLFLLIISKKKKRNQRPTSSK